MATAKKKTAKSKVWIVARFQERYEYRDDKAKKGALQYTRAFVSASGDIESRHYMDQLEDLKQMKNWCEITGAFAELVRRAANDVYQYRGYLLHQRRSADATTIARWLGVTTANCKGLLAALEETGFIKSVEFPEFPENSGESGKILEKPAKTKKKKLENEKKTKTKKTIKNKPTAGQKPAVSIKKEPARSTKENIQSESKINNQDQPETKLEGSAKGNEQTTQNPQRANIKLHKIDSTELNSTISEDGGSIAGNSIDSSPPSLSSDAVIERHAQLMRTSVCNDFASAIFIELKWSKAMITPDSSRGRSELGNYRCAWVNAQAAQLHPEKLIQLWEASVSSARDVGKYKNVKKLGSRGKVWRFEFNRRLAKYKAEQRASVSVESGFG